MNHLIKGLIQAAQDLGKLNNPQSPFLQYLNSVKSTAMKEEPTGQHPEAEEHILQMAKEVVEESVAHIRGVDSIDKAFYQTFWVKGYNAGQSLSRWREISVDGLPGEEYAGKYIIFAFSASAMVYKWEVLKFHKKSITDTFTHWREIELPS